MADVDPETAALLRQVHLEFNGLNRSRRGKAQVPLAKHVKREDGSHGPASGGQEESPSGTPEKPQDSAASGDVQARSGPGQGEVQGCNQRLKRLQKLREVQQHTDEDGTMEIEAVADRSLQPQASTKALEALQQGGQQDADVASARSPPLGPAIEKKLEEAAQMSARNALQAAKETEPSSRVKCWYSGITNGIGLPMEALQSRSVLASELEQRLKSEGLVRCPAENMHVVCLDAQGHIMECTPQQSESSWQAAIKAARRLYVSQAPAS